MKDLNKLNSKEFYEKVGKRQGWSFANMEYDKYESKYFDYYEFLSKNIKETDLVLDIGCGDSRKVIKYVKAKEVIGIDTSNEMIKKSKENYELSKTEIPHTFLLMDGDGKLDFADNSFDFIINRHCGCNVKEMYRVLKQNGTYIQEDIDENDCLELKVLFGRGQNYPMKERFSDLLWKKYEELGFSKIEFFPIREIEYYKTEDDLRYLLENTPIIPNFGDGEDDEKLFKEYCETHKTSRGIRLDRDLYGFILVK